jgi:hypothetical protein
MKRKSLDKTENLDLIKKMGKPMSKSTNKTYFGQNKTKITKPEESKTVPKAETSDVQQKRFNYELSLVNKNFEKRHYSPITKNKAKENFEDLILPLVLKTTLGGKHEIQKQTELEIIDKEYKSDDCINLVHEDKIG